MLLERLEREQAILNNALNKAYAMLSCEEFSTYLVNSGLKAIAYDSEASKRKVYKNYPNYAPNENEIYVNTSQNDDCLDIDLKEGVISLAIVVDFYIADADLPYLWKYIDATRQWIQQYLGGGIARIIGRAYTKADKGNSNHFTLTLILDRYDILTDETNPLVED